MKKNQIVILIVFIVAVALVILSANRTGSSPSENNSNILAGSANGTGTLVAVESFYDLGTISMSAGKVSRVFKITNTGTGQLFVKKIYTCGLCTTATLT